MHVSKLLRDKYYSLHAVFPKQLILLKLYVDSIYITSTEVKVKARNNRICIFNIHFFVVLVIRTNHFQYHLKRDAYFEFSCFAPQVNAKS